MACLQKRGEFLQNGLADNFWVPLTLEQGGEPGQTGF